MICKIRKWELSDAADLAAALSNKKVQDNLRDGLPYPYTEQDGIEFISAMLSAEQHSQTDRRAGMLYRRRLLGERDYDRSCETNLRICF